MPRFLLLIFVLSAFLIPQPPARAQNAPGIDSLKVELWPEYDQPSMLVIYRFSLSSDTPLPAQLNLRIPAASGEPFVVAVGPSSDQVGDVPHVRTLSGEWAEISFAATMPFVQFEYYDPGLVKQNSQRSFKYDWPGDYDVQSLVMEVQQPLDATDMRISPSLGRGQARGDGLVYYTSEIGSLTAGQSFSILLEYQKPTETLSVSRLAVEPSQPLTTDTTGRIRLESLLPWALVLLGLVLIGGGSYWYWQAGRTENRSRTKVKSRGRRRSPERSEGDGGEAPEAGVYCHQCGKRAAPNDRFCRSCGTRLRS
jgi:hypothetical protein